MPKLSDAQLVCLNAAAQRADRKLLPLPPSMKNAMINSRIEAGLRSRGLVEGEGRNAIITDAGLAAIGITEEGQPAPSATPKPEQDEAPAQTEEDADMAKTKSKSKKNAARKPRSIKGAVPRSRSDSKQAKMINLMQRPEGASLDELVKKFGWQPHTVRGAVAGALKKKMGLAVHAEKDEKRGLVYRIAA